MLSVHYCADFAGPGPSQVLGELHEQQMLMLTSCQLADTDAAPLNKPWLDCVLCC